MKPKSGTSWHKQGKWYNRLVGSKGHYYHEHVVLPNVLRLLQLHKESILIDIGCGQGILAKKIPQEIVYYGIDLAKSLISFAHKSDKNPRHTYVVADATHPLPLQNNNFTHAAAILSLQNMEHAELAIRYVSKHLQKNARYVIVLNHPSFRIPRQSGWGIGENKLQYRYVNRYMSPLRIPVTMHPGGNSIDVTWSFHQPLSFYAQALKENGFLIESIEEWGSDKESTGKAAKMENRSRQEIPLFMTLVCFKCGS